jgi:hypothetical protein
VKHPRRYLPYYSVSPGGSPPGETCTPNSLKTGVVGNYHFNGDLLDTLGLHNATSSGGITFGTGILGMCATSDGTGVVVFYNNPLDPGNVGDIGIWFKAAAFANPSTLIGFGGDDPNALLLFGVRNNGGTDYLNITYRNAEATELDVLFGNTPVTTGSWHCARFSTDGVTYKMTLDGVPQTISGTSGTNNGKWFDQIVTANPELTAFTLKVGGSYAANFTGNIDETTLWNRQLLAYEHQNYYNAGAANSYPFKYTCASYTTHEVFTSDVSHTRYGARQAVLLPNGNWLWPVDRFGVDPGDGASAETRFHTISLNASGVPTVTYVSTLAKEGLDTFKTCMGLLPKDASNTLAVSLVGIPGGNTKFVGNWTTDNGLTWGATFDIYSNPALYVQCGAMSWRILNSGRWVGAVEYTTQDPSTGDYSGFTLYSDDQGANWAFFTGVPAAPGTPSQFIERTWVYASNGDLGNYGRTSTGNDGKFMVSFSTDEAATYGTLTDLNTLHNPTQPNSIGAIKLSNNKYFCDLNTPSRESFLGATSDTMQPGSLQNYLLEVYNPGDIVHGTTEQAIGGCPFEIGDYICDPVLVSRENHSLWDLKLTVIKTSTLFS